jgi:hypothetical protein
LTNAILSYVLWSMTKRILAFAAMLSFGIALSSSPVHAQTGQSSAFLGTWCAQGDPAKRTSITASGPFFTLTNEVGSTSSGHITDISGRQIVALQWDFVRGNLSPDGTSISWSNGTYWARCPTHHRPVDLRGTWYMGGDPSKPCRIDQNGNSLSLQNESGQSASGSFTGRYSISTNWGGTVITGTISDDRKRISWSNGTYWTRAGRP